MGGNEVREVSVVQIILYFYPPGLAIRDSFVFCQEDTNLQWCEGAEEGENETNATMFYKEGSFRLC